MDRTVVYSPDGVFAGALCAALAGVSRPVRAADVRQLLELAANSSPDAVIAHILPGGSHQVITDLAAHAPVVVVGPDDEEAMLMSVESGATGYALQDGSLQAIVDAVEAVVDGRAMVPPMMLGSLLRAVVQRRRRQRVERESLEGLTPRELQVLDLLTSGQNGQQIARALIISPETVRTHIQHIMSKLDLHSRAEVVAFGGRNRLEEWRSRE